MLMTTISLRRCNIFSSHSIRRGEACDLRMSVSLRLRTQLLFTDGESLSRLLWSQPETVRVETKVGSLPRLLQAQHSTYKPHCQRARNISADLAGCGAKCAIRIEVQRKYNVKWSRDRSQADSVTEISRSTT